MNPLLVETRMWLFVFSALYHGIWNTFAKAPEREEQLFCHVSFSNWLANAEVASKWVENEK